jgi:hypothetical protein
MCSPPAYQTKNEFQRRYGSSFAAMPSLFSGTENQSIDEVRSILERMNQRSWRKDRERLLKLVNAI